MEGYIEPKSSFMQAAALEFPLTTTKMLLANGITIVLSILGRPKIYRHYHNMIPEGSGGLQLAPEVFYPKIRLWTMCAYFSNVLTKREMRPNINAFLRGLENLGKVK